MQSGKTHQTVQMHCVGGGAGGWGGGKAVVTPLKHIKYRSKKVREKSRECHNHKPQPFPDPKRKRKPTNLNKH